MIFVSSLFVALFAAVCGQGHIRDYRVNPYYDESPKPYSFSYNALLDDGVGQSSRTESGDGSGRVQGSYSLNNDEGHFRIVDYVADENGFRATIRTNEPGTESKNPADVVINSEAGPYPYVPIPRPRPVLEPVAPAAVSGEPGAAPEAAAPPRRPVYRRPAPYRGRIPYRPPVRIPYRRFP